MVVIESILETIVDNINSEIKDKGMKIILAIIFVLFYLFIVSGTMSIGINILNKDYFLGIIFILLSILIFVFFLTKFIIIYNKKMNKKMTKLSKIFKIIKK